MAIKAAAKKVSKSSTKVSAPKTSAKTRTSVQSHAVEKTVAQNSLKSFKVKRLHILIALAIIALGALLYFGRGLFVAAVVNGQPISRFSVISEAEKQSGQQSLQTLVRNTLIEQEARKSNVAITDQEINDEIKKIETSISKQGQKLDEVLAMQGMTQEDLKKIIRLQKLVEKIVGKDVKVSDEEINKYIEQNKDFLPKDKSEEELKKTAKESLTQQKLNTKINDWLTSLQTKAKIMYFVQY